MMPGDPHSPLSFERLTGSKLAGCAAYLLLIPAAAALGALLGIVVGMGLGALARSETLGLLLTLIFAPAGLLGSLYWGIRDYRRRSGRRILIHLDRIEVGSAGTPEVFRFEDLEWIEGTTLAARMKGVLKPSGVLIKLRRKDGRMLSLAIEEWPLTEIAQGLLELAVPAMTRTLSRRIDAGETVELRPGTFAALWYLLVGIAFVSGGGFLLYSWWRKKQADESYRILGLPVFLMLTGISALCMVGRARGGLLISGTGVRRSRGDDVIPWEAIRQLHVLPDSFRIETQEGKALSVGILARNYEACLALIQARIKK
jgi:hypothetical protein